MDRSSGLDQHPISRASTFTGDELVSKKIVKYGTGKHSNTPLVPQPSDSATDPLNWPTWKKDLNLLGILFSVAIAGVLKTFLVTVNRPLSINLEVKYSTVSILTGTPLILSAFTGLLSYAASQMIGKRMVYLGSAIFIFVGAMWNMHVGHSYSQFMGARALQGIGMGAFDTIPLSSIHDMYFEHERSHRITFYNTVMIGATWGAPILGGYLSQSSGGISREFMIISIFQAVGIVLLILCCGETSFYRSNTDVFPSKLEIENAIPNSKQSKWSSYLRSLHPMPFYDKPSVGMLMRPLRHLASPTMGLLFLMSGLLPAMAFAIGNSLSLLYSSLPTLLFPTRIGYLFTAPLTLTLLTTLLTPHTLSTLPTSPPQTLYLTLPAALLLSIPSLIAFAFYNHPTSTQSPLSLPTISLLFGLIVSGSNILQLSTSTYLNSTTLASPRTRTRTTTIRILRAKETETETEIAFAALSFYRNVLTGAIVLVVPFCLEPGGFMVGVFVGVGVVQVVFVGIGIGVLWGFGGWVERGDRMVLGRRGNEGRVVWEGAGSFMET